MDIEILLALQNFRNGFGEIFVNFAYKMTFVGSTNTVIAVFTVIYWCFSKNYGTYLLMGWSGNRMLNKFLKATVCAHRLLFKDARIIPHFNSMDDAAGYSFPSGHSMNAAALFGGAVVRKDFPKFLRIISLVTILLIALSRIYLGVHTPQDVLIGSFAGLLVMWLTFKLMQWLETHPDKDLPVAFIGIILSVAVAVYGAMKSYPVDYDVNGKILLEGVEMPEDVCKAAGLCTAFWVGWVLERRYVKFSTDISALTRASRLITGLLGYYVVTLIICGLIKKWIPGSAGSAVSGFLQMFYSVFFFPYCCKRYELN